MAKRICLIVRECKTYLNIVFIVQAIYQGARKHAVKGLAKPGADTILLRSADDLTKFNNGTL